MNVVLFETPRCHLCEVAAAALTDLGYEFDRVDASDDPTRFIRTPIIEVDGIAIAEGNVSAKQIKLLFRRHRLRQRFRRSTRV